MTFLRTIVVRIEQKCNLAISKKSEVSIHVSILYRHAILEYDQVDSSTEEPNIIYEQFFVISPDSSHDRHFTLYCQKQISEYLKSISAKIKIMHEFTDGCSSPIQEQKLHG
jgi:hypothetical protein